MSYLCTRPLVVVALLLAFIGQSIAAPVTCSTTDATAQPDVHLSMMKHDMPSANTAMHHQAAAKPDCCDDDCACPASACSSFSLVANTISGIVPATFVSISQSGAALCQPEIASLFRPPIFA